MKTFTIKFECENEVFADYLQDAIADVLLSISKNVRYRGVATNHNYPVRDSNGNIIGGWELEDRP